MLPRAQCLRTPDTTPVRNVAFGRGRASKGESHPEQMRQRIETDEGRAQDARRFATVEPVFGNLRYHKGLDRFTCRRRVHVDAQWKLFCVVHNIEKRAKLKYAASGHRPSRQWMMTVCARVPRDRIARPVHDGNRYARVSQQRAPVPCAERSKRPRVHPICE